MLTAFLKHLLIVVSLAFCGHMGNHVFVGASIAATIINVAGNSIIGGLACACDTLFSQTFGSKIKYKLGIVVQRSLIIMTLCCLPCCAVLINTESILIHMGQTASAARYGGIFATIYSFSLVGRAVSTVMVKYLQCQRRVLASMFIYMGSNVVNAGFQLLFFTLDFGIEGAAIALCLTNWFVAILHIVYIALSKINTDTWTGWSRDCLYDWCTFFSLAVPGIFMISLEAWSYEILIFVSAFIGAVSIASLAIVNNIAILNSVVPLGLYIAASVKIGNHLGANDKTSAFIASRITICLAVTYSILSSIFLVSVSDVLPELFTPDRHIASVASMLLKLLALFAFFHSIQSALSGIISGMGHQRCGAIIIILTCYVVNLPIAISLMLETSLKVYGAYIGIILGSAIQVVTFLIKIYKTDWNLECEKAQSRVGVQKAILTERNGDGTYTEMDSQRNETDEAKEMSDATEERQVLTENDGEFSYVVKTRVAISLAFLLVFAGGVTVKVFMLYKHNQGTDTSSFSNSTGI